MNLILDAFAWIFAPERLDGGTLSLPATIGQHLWFTLVSVLIAAVVAVPLGWWIGHSGRGRTAAVVVTGMARAIPSLGLVILLVMVMGVALKGQAAIIAFVVLAIPSLLAGAYAGLEAVDRSTVDAARAMGMSEWQILWRVEIPLGLPLLVSGLRAATLQVVATVAIAAYVGLGGVGFFIIQGIAERDFAQILGGSIVVVALALVLDGLLALVQRFVTPRGVRLRQHNAQTADPGPRRSRGLRRTVQSMEET